MTVAVEAGARVRLEVNGRRCESAAAADTPLIYVLRNDLGLKGTRFGCGTEQCGSCLVLVDGKEHGYWRVEEARLRRALQGRRGWLR